MDKFFTETTFKGVRFLDLQPTFDNPELYNDIITRMIKAIKELSETSDNYYLVGLEARGFIFVGTLAYLLNKPFTLIRKANKLPGTVVKKEYTKEYGKDSIEIQKGLLDGRNVILIDDILATGGTLNAACELLDKSNILGAVVIYTIPMDRAELKCKVKTVIE